MRKNAEKIKNMNAGNKKSTRKLFSWVLSLIILFSTINGIRLDVSAGNYPLVIPENMSIAANVGDTIRIKYTIFHSFNNEKLTTVVYDDSGFRVASAEKSFSYPGYNTEYILEWDTTDYSPGRYTVVSTASFYSIYEWHEAPTSTTVYVTLKDDETSLDQDISSCKISGLKADEIKVAKSSEITLTWNHVDGAEKYEVYQQNGKKWKKIKTTSKTSYTVKKLKANKSYKFKVRAVADGAKSAYSTVLTVKTVPETTSKLTLKAGKKQLTASWSKVSDISGYEVQYSTSKKFTKRTTKTVNVKKSSKKTTIKKLKKGKKYYVRIRTYKTVSGKKIYSDWSTVKNVKVK